MVMLTALVLAHAGQKGILGDSRMLKACTGSRLTCKHVGGRMGNCGPDKRPTTYERIILQAD